MAGLFKLDSFCNSSERAFGNTKNDSNSYLPPSRAAERLGIPVIFNTPSLKLNESATSTSLLLSRSPLSS